MTKVFERYERENYNDSKMEWLLLSANNKIIWECDCLSSINQQFKENYESQNASLAVFKDTLISHSWRVKRAGKSGTKHSCISEIQRRLNS